MNDSSLTLSYFFLRHTVEWNSVKMPFPVSDVMANYMQGDNGDEDGFIIITGGCDSIKGNERANFGEDDLFACFSTSNVTLKFDPFANTFETMATMPHERQRHAAAVMNGELYVFGGRDSNDDLVAAIDVRLLVCLVFIVLLCTILTSHTTFEQSFNPKTNTWTTRGELPEDVVTSDLTAWAWENYIYVTGGFIANYTAVGNTYRLDLTENPTDFESMGYEEVSSSPNPRGDFHAVELFGYAYLAGGITHLSDWCVALTTTERYHMATDTWEEIAPLSSGRADMAVAVLNNKIISMGGETKPEDCKNVSDPAYGSFPADHVEVLLNPSSSEAKWVGFAQFVDERFRFAAAVVPAQNRLYTFGGQLPFDFTCDCFPTSDDVAIGTEVYQEEQSLSGGAIAAIVLGSLVGVIVVAFITRKFVLKCNKEKLEASSASEFQATKDSAVE